MDHVARKSTGAIDYDPTRDAHLRRFFNSPFMQEHMRHAAALDRISDRRNKWNDAVEYLMEAGSAYSVGAIFNHNDGGSGAASGGSATAAAAAAAGASADKKKHHNQLRSGSASSNNKRRPHQPQINTNYRPHPPTSGRAGSARVHSSCSSAHPHDQQQQQQQTDMMNHRPRSSPAKAKKLPPLPRYNAALRNIRRFDDEVHRILVDGCRSEKELQEEERWRRTQQRLKVERMIAKAQSPKFGRQRDDEQRYDGKQRQQRASVDDGIMYDDDDDYGDDDDENDENANAAGKKGVVVLDSTEVTPTRGGKVSGWITYAITRFQACCIGWIVRNRVARARDAAIVIQRAFRGHLTDCGVHLAVRIIQRAGRALRMRRRMFLMRQRQQLWLEAAAQHEKIVGFCIALHRASAAVGKLPVTEAAQRELLAAEHVQSVKDRHFEPTAGELRRRALLTSVAPKGNLRRESFRRLLDDDDDARDAPHPNEMHAMDTPSALVPVLQEIEEEEPSRRVAEEPVGSSSSPPASNTAAAVATADDGSELKKSASRDTTRPGTPTTATAPQQPESPQERVGDGGETAAAVGDTTIMPIDDTEEEL